MLLRYLTHPQVRIDPAVPIPEWGLSEVGRARVQQLIDGGALSGTLSVVSSAERKAIETAEPIAEAFGVLLGIREAMHENDRSATGYLPPDEFELMADAFFANPNISIRGWESAAEAQRRIVAETQAALQSMPEGDVLFVGHGAVGTLLYCHLAGLPIDRRYDQLAGGGNVFSVDLSTRDVLHGWRPLELLERTS